MKLKQRHMKNQREQENFIKITFQGGKMSTEYTKIGFLKILSQFESYSKKKQKRCIKYLKSKGIDTTDLELQSLFTWIFYLFKSLNMKQNMLKMASILIRLDFLSICYHCG